jgi:NAD+ kinase
MIGINMGTKGYLTEIEVGNLTDALDCLLDDSYHIESRMMLSGVIHKSGKSMPEMCALNEVSITRRGSLAVIHYNVYVNGKLLKVYSGDGIMVSTPTGSTGYNLSAGGPIATPQAELMLLTPICPHTFNTRTVILSPFDVVEIEIAHGRDGKTQEVEVNFDGNYTKALAYIEGEEKILNVIDGKCSVRLQPGQGAFVIPY